MKKKLLQFVNKLSGTSNINKPTWDQDNHQGSELKEESLFCHEALNACNTSTCLSPYYTCPYFNKMHVEITSLCNLKCSHCSRTFSDYPSKNKIMEVALFKKIVDEVSTRIDLLQMQGFGEPTMHPQFVELLEYAVNSGKFNSVMITSNLLYKSADDYSTYFEKGLTSLIISFDSINEVNIAKIRQGTDLPKLISNIQSLSVKHAGKIALQTTVNRINIHELDDIAEFIIGCGMKTWILNAEQHIKTKSNSRIEFEKQGNNTLYPNELEKLSKIVVDKYRDKISIDTSLLYQHPVNRSRCSSLWEWLLINSEGNVVPCCRYMDDNYVKLGDVKVMSIDEIWRSPQMQKFRNEMYDKQPIICQNCIHY